MNRINSSRLVATQTKPLPAGTAEFDRLAGSAFIDCKAVSRLLDVSVPTVWRWTRIGKLPAPVKLSAGSTRWQVEGLRRCIAELAGGGAAQ